jgi:5'-3' exonuclease
MSDANESVRRLLLVDGTNIVMRYAHAMMPHGSVQLPEESDVTRERASDVLRAVERAIRECAVHADATHAIVAIDRGETWRRAPLATYKASRAGGTSWWSDRLADRLESNGKRSVSQSGFEEDDLIATLNHRANANGYPTAVLSGDSDLLVLASELCDVYQFGRNDEPRFVKRTPDWIAQKYQIASPAELRDFKAIVGEPGESLPGLDGYGPVKARTLLARFGSLEGILDSVALTSAQHERLMLMRDLVTLRTDVPLDAIPPAVCRLDIRP